MCCGGCQGTMMSSSLDRLNAGDAVRVAVNILAAYSWIILRRSLMLDSAQVARFRSFFERDSGVNANLNVSATVAARRDGCINRQFLAVLRRSGMQRMAGVDRVGHIVDRHSRQGPDFSGHALAPSSGVEWRDRLHYLSSPLNRRANLSLHRLS